MNRLKNRGYCTLESDSHFYIDNAIDLFPNMNDCVSKIQCRYLEIKTALNYCHKFTDGLLFVDRGVVNQIIWSKILYYDMVDDYLKKKEDYLRLMNNADKYVELENSLNPYRILIRTRNPQIIEDSLSDYRYYNGTSHDVFRIDTFDNPEKYKNLQKAYYRYHKKLTTSVRYDIMDGDVETEINKLEDFIDNHVYNINSN